MSVIGGVLFGLALPLPWYGPVVMGYDRDVTGVSFVFSVLADLWFWGPRQRWGALLVLLGMGSVVAVLHSQVNALRQPGIPTQTWVTTGCLFGTIVAWGVSPLFSPQGPSEVPIAFGYWVALGCLLVVWLGSLVRNITALRAKRQATSSTAPQEAASRRMRNALGWGFVVGLLPLALALVLLPTPRLLTIESVAVVQLYSLAWIGVGLLRLLRPTPSHRAFAKGMMIALLVTGGLGLFSYLGLLYQQATFE